VSGGKFEPGLWPELEFAPELEDEVPVEVEVEPGAPGVEVPFGEAPRGWPAAPALPPLTILASISGS
jgi:hypothetical protein